ncbi:MAG: thioredoxin family protein, partial [Myxococcaceae bacterium]|nr:thioredoxin family protein [Myxococcaceae bacterium]
VAAPLGAFAPGDAVAAVKPSGPASPPSTPGAPPEVPSSPPPSAGGAPGVALAFVLAFLGGALLNLMPCVFPVLALKVFSFLKLVGGGRRRAAGHAAAYTLGIEASLLVLALAVLAVRAAGAQVGWGFQFQEPLFVAAVSAVLVVFALNLFGVFTVGGDAAQLTAGVERTDGWMRSAGEGVLAVVLATPCSAPFLGSAVGFALAQPAWVVLGVFLALGLGLAAPFVVLVLVPQGARRLPKPGAWMERGKQLLGFALLGTAAWLVWVLGRLSGVDGVGRLLAFLVVVGLGTWLWGLAQQGRGWALRAVALALVVGSAAVTLRFAPAPEARGAALAEGWQPYSEAVLAEGLAAGRPVFVDFTADWCLTCKYNERTVLAAPAVREAFARSRAVLLVVDYTRRDARIGEMLARHGRAGVPLYLLYRPEQEDAPEVLPELLTEERVLEALRGPPAG